MSLGAVCTNGHGGTGRAWSRGPWLRRAVFAGALASLAGFATVAAAAGREGDVRVLWAAAGRLYLAAPDSGAIAPRMRVRVLDRDREVARGEVAHVLDGVVASVTLEAPLDPRTRPEHLDRLLVVIEPATSRPIATLRVGVPAPARRPIAPPCRDTWLDKAALPRPYLDEPLGRDVVRLVVDAAADTAGESAWPETLLVRFYAERADEEIALERGELDAAVFWPGEPSARLRDHAAGFDLLRGLRSSGAFVVGGAPAGEAARAAIARDLDALNDGLFSGDLVTRPGAVDSTGPGPDARAGTDGPRWTIDAGLPGAAAMERLLNRGRTGTAARTPVRLSWRDAPLDGPGPEDARAGTPGLLLRCPLLCAPARADDVRALGADRLANLVGCGTGRRP